MNHRESLLFGASFDMGESIYHGHWIVVGLIMGKFVLQLISLAGLHRNATITTEILHAFKGDSMLAYVRVIHGREKEMDIDILTH